MITVNDGNEILEWFCGRAGDHIPNDHYQRLLEELKELLEELKGRS